MAKPLVFQFGDQDLSFTLGKVDRSKLYGFKEIEVLDTRKRPCELATLADDGKTVVGKGGTGLCYLTADGDWAEKRELTPIDVEGKKIEPVKSSFDAPIKLFDTVTPDEYMMHNIRLVYRLESDDDLAALKEALDRGAIFSFPYSYRGGLEADSGFLIAGAEGDLFLVVGSPTQIEFVGLQQAAAVVEDEEEDAVDDVDIMDFDMI